MHARIGIRIGVRNSNSAVTRCSDDANSRYARSIVSSSFPLWLFLIGFATRSTVLPTLLIYLSTSFPKSVLDFHGILQLSTNFPSCRNSGQTLTKLWLNVNFQVLVLPSFTCTCLQDVINSLSNWKIRTFVLWHNLRHVLYILFTTLCIGDTTQATL